MAQDGDTSTTRDYWFCQLAGWGVLAALGLLSSSAGNPHGVLRYAAAKTACVAAGLLVSHGWHRYLKQRGYLVNASRLPLARLGAALLAPTLLQSTVLLGIDQLVLHGGIFSDDAELVFDLGLVMVLWYLVFGVWTLCYAMALERRRAARAELDMLKLAVSAKDAELRALQFQVNPHFFFNSLNSVRALVYQDADAAAQAIGKLAGMMRYSLGAGRSPTVPLADEVQAVSAYLDMERLRFDDRLQLEMNIAADVAALHLPPMALQTLAENAIRYGVERAVGPCRVCIRAQRDGELLRIEVANQGRLASDSSSTQVGLLNTTRRLALQFGPQADCTLAEDDGWVRATLTLPARTS